MANEAQVKILKERGVAVWNQWRLTNPKIPIDLTGVDFAGVDLRGADLNNANLTRANFGVANMVVLDRNLARSPLTANLHGSDLRNANLTSASLCGVNLGLANLDGALLFGTDLDQASYNRENPALILASLPG